MDFERNIAEYLVDGDFDGLIALWWGERVPWKTPPLRTLKSKVLHLHNSAWQVLPHCKLNQ